MGSSLASSLLSSSRPYEEQGCVYSDGTAQPVLHPCCFCLDDSDELRNLQADSGDAGDNNGPGIRPSKEKSANWVWNPGPHLPRHPDCRSHSTPVFTHKT